MALTGDDETNWPLSRMRVREQSSSRLSCPCATCCAAIVPARRMLRASEPSLSTGLWTGSAHCQPPFARVASAHVCRVDASMRHVSRQRDIELDCQCRSASILTFVIASSFTSSSTRAAGTAKELVVHPHTTPPSIHTPSQPLLVRPPVSYTLTITYSALPSPQPFRQPAMPLGAPRTAAKPRIRL